MDTLGQILARPEVQTAILGILVKLCTDVVKKLATSGRQPDGTRKYNVPVQVIVVVCTLIATIASVYLKVALGGGATDALADLIVIGLPIYLSAMGFQNLSTFLKEQGEFRNVTKQ